MLRSEGNHELLYSVQIQNINKQLSTTMNLDHNQLRD